MHLSQRHSRFVSIRPGSPGVKWARPRFLMVAPVILTAFGLVIAGSALTGPRQLSPALDPLTYKYPQDLQATLSAFGKGVDLLLDGRADAALAVFPSDDAASSTAVSDYVMLFKARAALALERAKEALALFKGLRSQHPDSPIALQALLGEARASLKLQDPGAVLALLENGKIKDSAEVLLLRAQALEAAGRRSDAIQTYLRVFADYVDSDEAKDAERRLRVLMPAFLTRSDNRELLVRRCENLIRAGRNMDARTLLLKLDGSRTSGPQAGKIGVLLGDADTNLRRYTEALRYVRRVTEPSLAARAIYLEGVCFRGLRNEAAFLETRDRALRLYPQSPYTEKLLYSVATYYDVENEAGPASEAYKAIVRGFPQGEYIERALWKVALYAYVGKRYQEALAGFSQCLLANPSPAAASAPAYWMGRCCELIGDPQRAVYFFGRAQALANNSYYGQRAQEALAAIASRQAATPADAGGLNLEQAVGILNGIQPVAPMIDPPSGEVVQIVERARQLVAAGLTDLALLEINRGYVVQGNNGKSLCYGASRIYQSKADFYGAISMLRRAFPDYADLPPASLPDEVWDVLFPVRHFDVVTQNAARNNLDPDLILALIRQESAFRETARSKANARGLMQVLPSTGRLLARQAGVSRYTTNKLYRPETNIALGTRYLASLLQQYGGRVELALAAYNAGDSRVDRWLQEFGDVDMAEFVERIPFSETRAYVKQVMSNRAHYHLRTSANLALSPALRKE